jgi:hypothetical protein
MRRSQIASATLGSPMAACHAVGGSWLAMSVALTLTVNLAPLTGIPCLRHTEWHRSGKRIDDANGQPCCKDLLKGLVAI